MPRGIAQANTGYAYERERHYDIPHYEYHDDHDEVIDFDVVDNDRDRYRHGGGGGSGSNARKRDGHRGGRRHRGRHHHRQKRGAPWDRGKEVAYPTVPG